MDKNKTVAKKAENEIKDTLFHFEERMLYAMNELRKRMEQETDHYIAQVERIVHYDKTDKTKQIINNIIWVLDDKLWNKILLPQRLEDIEEEIDVVIDRIESIDEKLLSAFHKEKQKLDSMDRKLNKIVKTLENKPQKHTCIERLKYLFTNKI